MHCIDQHALLSIGAKSRGNTQVAITILGRMYFGIIVTDKRTLYVIHRPYTTSDYSCRLERATGSWALAHDFNIAHVDWQLTYTNSFIQWKMFSPSSHTP